MVLQASALLFAAIGAGYAHFHIDAAVNAAALESDVPVESYQITWKAEYFHFQVRLTLWHACLFTPLLVGTGIWARTGRRIARIAALVTTLFSVLCCFCSGFRLYAADEPVDGLDEALPAAFGQVYPEWVDLATVALTVSFFPAIVAAALIYNELPPRQAAH
ncbi:hypothetical protein SAMN05444365_101845 [Micromonospora pattaloongensis]|uniref:Uncharacterized protein n=2 Tax=Micromonospora pattaloongensis TaxID=405436 RepID=A0A1H3HHP7_9ACTN|nr:hypothetical protein SAMN05444365_101845 [Micromonospora pattaloongensis]